MRNSVLPIVMTLVVAAIAFVLVIIHPSPPPGTGGPDINPGIFRLPKKERKLVQSLQGLAVTDQVTVEAAADHREGLEPDAWGRVVVADEDQAPVTRAVVLGLAEELTRRGAVVVIDTIESHTGSGGDRRRSAALPLPSDRVLRVSTLSGTAPASPGAEFTAQVRVATSGTRFPAGHPAAALQGAGGIRTASLLIDHRSGLPAAAQAQATWSGWYAAIGRGIAGTALAHLEVGDQLAVDRQHGAVAAGGRPPLVAWHRPLRLWLLLVVPVFIGVRLWAWRRMRAQGRGGYGAGRLGAVRAWVLGIGLAVAVVIIAGPHRPTAPEPAQAATDAWATALPLPPTSDLLRWHAANQDDLVRGWVGEIRGTIAFDRAGSEQAAIVALDRLLTRSGKWQEQTVDGSTVRTWSSEQPSGSASLSATPVPGGWDLAMWQERQAPAEVHAAWLDAAEDGDRTARRQLRRHLGRGRLPDDQQRAALALLRRDPDAAELAMIAASGQADGRELWFAATAAWVAGRRDEQPGPPAGGPVPPTPPAAGERRADQDDPPWTVLPKGIVAPFPPQPLLVQAGNSFALLLYGDAGSAVDATWWARSPGQPATRGVIAAGAGATIPLAEGALVVEIGKSGPTLTHR